MNTDPKATGLIPTILAVMLPLLLGITIYALLCLSIPAVNHDVLLVVITALVGSIQTIVNFHFGSSSSSRAKDDTIASQVLNQSPGDPRPFPQEPVP